MVKVCALREHCGCESDQSDQEFVVHFGSSDNCSTSHINICWVRMGLRSETVIQNMIARLAASFDAALSPISCFTFAFTGKKFTFMSDPDGLPIEFYEQ